MLHEAAANIVGLNTGRRGEWPHQVQDAVDSLVHRWETFLSTSEGV